MTLSRLARYPAEYHQILLALPADGSPIDVDYGSPEAAHKERLQLYNFLKFLHRNPAAAIRFNNRHNLVTMSIEGSRIIFQLRVKAGSSALAARLAALAAEGAIAPQALNVQLDTIPHAAMDDVSFESMESAIVPPPPQDDVYNSYAARHPAGRVIPTVEPAQLPSADWLPNAPAEMPESISRPPVPGTIPAGMGGEPLRGAGPDYHKMLRLRGEEIERDNAEGAATPRAAELSPEMKAYNERHHGKPNQ